MKLFKLLAVEIKDFFKKPVIAILLILGLSMSAFAGTVYYSSVKKSTELSKTYLNQQRSVEFNISSDNRMMRESVNKLTSLLDSGELPYAVGVYVIGYGYSDYDMIGALYKSDTALISGGAGEMITQKYAGKNAAAVSSDVLKNGEKLGDKLKIAGGNRFEIVGIFNRSVYTPYIYDIRRMLPENVAVPEYAKALSERADNCLMIPLDVFTGLEMDMGELPYYAHITFGDELDAETRNHIYDVLTENGVAWEFTDFADFTNLSFYDVWGLAIIYTAAILIALVNTFALLVFYLKSKDRTNSIYSMLGALRQHKYISGIAEVILLSALCSAVGGFAGYLFISKTDILGKDVKFSLSSVMLVFAILCVVGIVAVFTASAKKKKHLSDNVGDIGKIPSRRLYMLSFHYKKENMPRIIALWILSLIVCACFSYAFTFAFEGTKYYRYYNDNFKYPTYAVDVTDEMYFEVADTVHSGLSEYDSEYYRYFEEQLLNLNCLGVGKMQNGPWLKSTAEEFENWSLTEYGWTFMRMVNEDFCRYSPIPLRSGSWDEIINYDPSDETADIPCVIPYEFSKVFPLNSRFEYLVASDYNSGYVMRGFKVVGVIDKSAMDYFGSAVSPSGMPVLKDRYLCEFPPLVYNMTPNDAPSGLLYIYTPFITMNGEHPVCDDVSPFPFFMVYTGETDDITEIRNSMGSDFAYMGEFTSMKMAGELEKENFETGGGAMYYMHAVISLTMLFVSIGGFRLIHYASNRKEYGICFLCGQSKQSMLNTLYLENFLDMFVPGILGILLGIRASVTVGGADRYTQSVSALIGAASLVVMWIVVNIITYAVISSMKSISDDLKKEAL